MRPRPETDRYLAAVESAVASPGDWILVRDDFESKANAQVTADCLEEGYLRVTPRDGDRERVVAGRRYIATARAVTSRVEAVNGHWRLRIQFDDAGGALP